MKANPRVGSIIADNYQLMSIAGSGGMGTVYKAKQLGLERLVAVKLLDPLRVADDDSRIRFEREAKSISSLSHTHIAGFYAYGFLENAVPYIVMEWLDGQTLAALIRNENGVSCDRVIKVALQISEALGAAHRSGIIHRDLKPANVLLLSTPEPDYVKIVDFGLARILSNSESAEQKLTETGLLLGTPNYLSPELSKGARADSRSDIYALGCILYEMICGEAPFVADNPIAVVFKHANEKVIPLSRKIKVPLPEGLESTVLKCLEKSPQDRYQSMDELHRDLLNVRDHNTVPSLYLSSKDRKLRRREILAPAVALAIFAMVLICVATQWLGSEPGIVARAEFMLKNDYGRRNILDCLDISERLARQGKKASAERIEQAVDQVLKINSMESKQAVRSCLALAGDLQRRGDNKGAFNYAFKALKILHVLTSMSNQMDGKEKILLLVDQSDAASGIMLRSQRTLSKNQLKIPLAIAMQLDSYRENGNGNLLDLILETISKNASPLSDEVLRCMFAKDIVLAKHAPLAELDKMLNKSTEALGKYQGIAIMRQPPTPCLPWHLCQIAKIVFDRDHSACRKYVQLAENVLQKADWDKEIEKESLTMAQCCDEMAQIYIGLGDLKNALAYSTEAVSCRPLPRPYARLTRSLDKESVEYVNAHKNAVSSHIDSVLYLITLSKVLFLSGELTEAKTVATNTYEFLKIDKDPDPSVLVYRSECANQLFQILIGLDQNAAADSLVDSELKVKYYNQDVLATLCVHAGKWAKAEQLLQRTLAIRKDLRVPADADVFQILGDCYVHKAKYAEAEPMYKQSLEIREKSLGYHSQEAIECLVNKVAETCNEQGKYVEAEQYFKRSLLLREKALGPNHLYIVPNLDNLAETCCKQGNYAEAERYFRRSLLLREKALGPNHPDLIPNLDNLAGTCCKQGNYAEAERYFRRSLLLRENALGPNHPNLVPDLDGLAETCCKQGKNTEAEQYFQRSLQIKEKSLDPNHPEVATGLENYSATLRGINRNAEADKLEARAQAIRAFNVKR